jgi:hypothetical protein
LGVLALRPWEPHARHRHYRAVSLARRCPRSLDKGSGGDMSLEPKATEWFPDGKVDGVRVSELSMILMQTARINGFTRETYAVAVAQMAESLAGFDGSDDLDGDVLRFISERLRAVADAIDRSRN